MRRPTLHPVPRALHGPLLMGGRLLPAIERRFFFGAAGSGLVVFYLGGVVPGFVIGAIAYAVAWALRHDPVWLPSHLCLWRRWTVYDPGTHEPAAGDLCD